MTAPVITELQRRVPDMRLTIQTTVARDFLETRYRDFIHVPEIADFGFKMRSSTAIDLDASAQTYARLYQDMDVLVGRNAELLAAGAPDVVVGNAPFVPLAAAQRLGIPAFGLSSVNWADMYRHYLGDRPEAEKVLPAIAGAYESARSFLRSAPAQDMSLSNQVDIGPIFRVGRDRREEINRIRGGKIGLVAFGGIDHPLDYEAWPRIDGWFWIVGHPVISKRNDMISWDEVGLPFADLIASVDVCITKPGYGTFTEAAGAGTPVLYLERPDWPECPHLQNWLGMHSRCLSITPDTLAGPALERQLHRLFCLPEQCVALPTGIQMAADRILDYGA